MEKLLNNDLAVSQPTQGPIRTTSSSVIILVLSQRDNIRQREVIRKTWASNHTNVYFLIGAGFPPFREFKISTLEDPTNDVLSRRKFHMDILLAAQALPPTADQKTVMEHVLKVEEVKSADGSHRQRHESATVSLNAESSLHQDLVFLDMIDSYQNLTLKVTLGLKWALNFHPNGQFFTKIDDDSFLKVKALENYVKTLHDSEQTLYPQRALYRSKLYIGRMQKPADQKFGILTEGRWADFKFNSDNHPYHPGKYPTYANGCAGYVLSRYLVNYIVERYQSGDLILYPNEDTAIGIWLDQADPDMRNRMQYIDSREYFGDACEPRGSACFGAMSKLLEVHNMDILAVKKITLFDAWDKRITYSHQMSFMDLEKCFEMIKRYGAPGQL